MSSRDYDLASYHAAILDFAEEHVTRMFAAAKGYGYPIVGYHPFLSFRARTRIHGIQYRESAATLALVDRADR